SDPVDWFFTGDGVFGQPGRCLPWEEHGQCLVEGLNAFATVADCERECHGELVVLLKRNSAGYFVFFFLQQYGSRDRCSPVSSRPCGWSDTRLPYVLGRARGRNAKHRLSAESHCVRLPPSKCASDEFGFASLNECREACERSPENAATPASRDRKCRTGSPRHDCRREDRRLPVYYDVEEDRCLRWENICLVDGFPDKLSCELQCGLL
ncbi:unnamed protein product, partial [Ixodes hexagonus]